MSTITRLLARATGPGRCRTTLRQQTRAVRTYREAFAALEQVQTTWPRGVLGGDILDLLSDRLRAMLDVEEAAGPMLRADPAARARLLSLPSAPHETRDIFLTQLLAGQRGPLDAIGITSTGKARTFSLPTRHNGSHNESSLPRPPALDRRQAMPNSVSPQPLGRPRRAAVAPQTTHRRQHETAVEPIFSRTIHEYWRLSAGTEREPTPPEPTTTTRHAERQLPDLSDLAGRASATSAWPEMPGRELAVRLQAFAAGQGGALAPAPQAQEPTSPHTEERMETPDGMPPARHPDNASTLQALSDTMAMILRTQALYHGIDLT
jgi:hypothetical protein